MGTWRSLGRGTGSRIVTGRLALAGCVLAVLCTVASSRWGSPLSLLSLVTAAGLGLLAGSDVESRLLPRRLVRLLAAALTVTLVTTDWLAQDWSPSRRAAVGAVACAAVLGPLWWAAPDAFAFGDLKVSVLATAAASACSWPAAQVLWFVAGTSGAAIGVLTRSRSSVSKAGRRRTIPFVPCLAAGFVVGAAFR